MDISISQATLNTVLYTLGLFVVLFLESKLIKGKSSANLRYMVMLFTVIIGAVVIGAPFLSGLGGAATLATPISPQTPVPAGGVVQTVELSSTVTQPIEVVNSLNTSLGNTEYRAANITPYTAVGERLADIRVEASASGASWTGGRLGTSYVLKGVSYNNSLNSFEDMVTYTTVTSPPVKRISTTRATTLTFRVKDLRTDLWDYDTLDAETATAEASGVIFSSSVDNATQTALGAGQSVRMKIEITPTISTGRFGDRALYVGFNAPTTSFDPAKIGSTVNGVGGGLTRLTTDVPNAVKTDGVDELYKFNNIVGISGSDPTYLEVTIPAYSDSTNPSDDVDVWFYSEGAYLDNGVVKYGIVGADGTTYIHAPQHLTLQVS